jgi:uncharacterized protein
MPAASLLTLLDDITLILDDVWIMTKMSASKTAGVLGDDLALNAEQAIGLHPDRELPVIYSVAKGSAKNKALLIPAALLLRTAAPWLVQPLLMAGGLFLCYEGVEKLLHKVGSHHEPMTHSQPEDERIRGAVRTDFILSAEILAITLGVVAEQSFWTVLLVLLTISILMTIGVYGIVAAIVKLDDLGLHLQSATQPWKKKLGMLVLAGAPRLLQLLSWLGTLAIFCVGGGIIAHGIPALHHHVEHLATPLALLAEGATGLVMGSLAMLVVTTAKRLRPGKTAEQDSSPIS